MSLSERGQLRADRWKFWGIQLPFTICLRCDIPEANFHGPTGLELIGALKEIDREFEIIFDPLCRESETFGPAHFLYKKTISRNGPDDALQLQMPLQWEIDTLWPEGRPRHPGMWLIPEVKKRDNARLNMSPEQACEHNTRQRAEDYKERQAAKERAFAEPWVEVDEEMDPYVNRGRCTQPARGERRPNWEGKPGKKIISIPTPQEALSYGK